MIYLDNASTTKIYEEVNKKILELNEKYYFNPSALYKSAIDTKNLLEQARAELAKNLGTSAEHILFTSGATEANNLAIFGMLTGKKEAEYIFSNGEHPSVYNIANQLKIQSKIVKFINLNKNGTINIEELKNVISANTHMVSIIHVSNETGAINDIASISKLIKQTVPTCLVHCDGVQAFCKVDVNLSNTMVDAYTISSHKICGPKGVGAFYLRHGVNLKPSVFGGGQESNIRPGTENVPGILGFVKAAEIMQSNFEQNYKKTVDLKNYMMQKLQQNCTNF
ncbi:MAG TPA: cysteine desulfurase NifS, partial [Clostridiales bacterium]|nr:cysteine desulfurase NifS [Clostridiales bacterium]